MPFLGTSQRGMFEINFARKCHSKQSAVEEVDVAAKASMYELTDKDRRENHKNPSVVRQQVLDAIKTIL